MVLGYWTRFAQSSPKASLPPTNHPKPPPDTYHFEAHGQRRTVRERAFSKFRQLAFARRGAPWTLESAFLSEFHFGSEPL